VAVTNLGSNTVSVLVNQGHGSFAPQETFATGSAPPALAIGDLDGDGDPDLAVANAASHSVIVLANCARSGVPFCAGDGSGTPCPCGNSGQARHGCANSSSALGAKLAATGNARAAADTIVLEGSSMPPNTTALYLQGRAQANNGSGAVLGDGLRCLAGSTIRLAARNTTTAGTCGYGGPLGDTPVSVRGLVPASGGTREYQIFYRDAANFCTNATFNLSNGVQILWVP
jgi:hypothetical protein